MWKAVLRRPHRVEGDRNPVGGVRKAPTRGDIGPGCEHLTTPMNTRIETSVRPGDPGNSIIAP